MKRALIIIGLVGIAGAATAGLLSTRHGTQATGYRLVEVSRGDVQQTVSSTGTLGAVRMVQVGTQVSGQIAELGADFNDRVRQGQVIARLDSTLLAQAVEQAETDVNKARADVEQTRFLSDQADTLHAVGSMTDTDYRAALYNAAVARTSLQSSQIELERAQQNLRYATIRSPIDGIVVERDVDVGQTVAASLQAPQLFLIAEDLRQMQILASVDESDIGQIADGQEVQFTVQAYPNRTFTGRVEQKRLQSKVSDNVVNYTVVVAVDNPDGALLPGMTATLSFQVAKAAGVLRVPNAALRFRPSTEMLAEARARNAAAGDTSAVGTRSASSARAASAGATGRAAGGASSRSNTVTLWVLDAGGKPQAIRAHTGLTDGQETEVSSPQLREGMQIISGLTTGSTVLATTSGTTTNPFQGQQQGRRPPGGF